MASCPSLSGEDLVTELSLKQTMSLATNGNWWIEVLFVSGLDSSIMVQDFVQRTKVWCWSRVLYWEPIWIKSQELRKGQKPWWGRKAGGRDEEEGFSVWPLYPQWLGFSLTLSSCASGGRSCSSELQSPRTWADVYIWVKFFVSKEKEES